MTRLWGWRAPKRGLGMLITENGLALAQSQTAVKAGHQLCDWHWHLWSLDLVSNASQTWPDPAQVRRALVRSGFQAQATALAVPEPELQRFSLPVEPGWSTRQTQQFIANQLDGMLQSPLDEVVWDFQVQADKPATPDVSSTQPAWLQAAMQAQATQTAEVCVIARAWVNACEQWCRALGLQLVRLEPPWQASLRWQTHVQNHQDHASEVVAQALTFQQQAVLGGLALGVVRP